jgi:signal transduction histidine kinase
MELAAFRAVVNGLPVVLFALDARGKILLSEGGGLQPLGFTPGQVVGTSALELYREVPWIVDSLKRALSGESFTGRGEVSGLTFETTYVPVFARDGQVLEVLGLSIDITERTRAERERELLIGKLNEALGLRDAFLAIASHELRTPLSTLSLKLELLLRRAQGREAMLPAADVARELSYLARQCTRLIRLVNDLFDVAHISRGRLKLIREPIDLGELIVEITDGMRGEFERAGVALQVQAVRDVRGSFDRTRMEQVLHNLLANALRHGAGPVEVTLTCDPLHARLCVSDHGPGIPKDQQERVFDRFVRIAPVGLGGLGLGLHICRSIVEAHGGRIWVESQPGHGSAFHVLLPLRAPVRVR